jgi:hypothetical protein
MKKILHRTTHPCTTMNTNIVPNTLEKHIVYLAQHMVLVCRQCQYGIIPSGIERHFIHYHGIRNTFTVSPMIRKELVELATSLELIRPEDITIPDEVEVIPSLALTDGFECEICGKLAGTVLSMEKHCNTQHGWKKTQTIEWRKCNLQRFFAKPNIRYVFLIIYLTIDTSKLLYNRIYIHWWKY